MKGMTERSALRELLDSGQITEEEAEFIMRQKV